MKLALALAACAAPVLAIACPVCARDATPHAALLIGAMIAAPYLVALALLGVIRRGGP